MLRCRHSWWALLYIRNRSYVLNYPVFCNMGMRYWSYSEFQNLKAERLGSRHFLVVGYRMWFVQGWICGQFCNRNTVWLTVKEDVGDYCVICKKHYVFSELRTLVFECVSGYVSRTEKPALYVCLAGVRMSRVLHLKCSFWSYSKHLTTTYITKNLGCIIFGCVVRS